MAQNAQAGGSAATNFGMIAWITYGVLSGSGHWIAGALAALAVASAIVAHEHKNHATKIMSCTTVGFFAFALVTTIVAGPMLFKSYNVFLTWSLFAVVTWITLLIGFPFTIQYAREQTPPEVWKHPLFMRLNVILTVVFGLMFTVNAGLGVLALRIGHVLTLGLILPVALLIAAIVFSAQYPKSYARHFAPEWAARQAAEAGSASD
jgi:all-trans-retinol 13,14-reductase